jgi:hypothetical protein
MGGERLRLWWACDGGGADAGRGWGRRGVAVGGGGWWWWWWRRRRGGGGWSGYGRRRGRRGRWRHRGDGAGGDGAPRRGQNVTRLLGCRRRPQVRAGERAPGNSGRVCGSRDSRYLNGGGLLARQGSMRVLDAHSWFQGADAPISVAFYFLLTREESIRRRRLKNAFKKEDSVLPFDVKK